MASLIIEDAKYACTLDKFSPHSHNSYEIIYLKKGELELTVDEKTYTAVSPSLIFLSKLEQHSIHVIGDDYERCYLRISPLLASNYIRDYTLLTVLSNRPDDFCHVLSAKAFYPEADRIFTACVNEFNCNLPYSQQKQISLLTELLILIYRNAPSMFSQENSKCISVIWKIQLRLEQNCQEHFSLESLAEEYHLSKCYLAHLFKKVTGYSIMQYLAMCRLSLARQLLSETNMSITEIVFNTGFSDSSNFSRLFKRELKISPNDYRKKETK